MLNVVCRSLFVDCVIVLNWLFFVVCCYYTFIEVRCALCVVVCCVCCLVCCVLVDVLCVVLCLLFAVCVCLVLVVV